MANLSAGIQARELVQYFMSKAGINKSKKWGQFITQAKSLLDKYTYDEVTYIIDECFKRPPMDGIYSFGFIVYRSEEIMKAKKGEEAAQRAKDMEAKSKDYGNLPKSSDNSSKLKRFGRKEFDWNGS